MPDEPAFETNVTVTATAYATHPESAAVPEPAEEKE